MRLLLPPSETKTTGGRGRSLSGRPAHPQLGPARAVAQAALRTLLAGDPSAAAAALLLPPGTVDAALRADAAVLTAPTLPALRRYAGVVYDGLASTQLTIAEQRLAARNVLVFSGLFGVVRGDEPVPDYRVPAKAVLPGIGTCSTYWKPVLTQAVPALLDRGLVVDLRSSDYAAMWRADQRRPVVSVRVLSPLPSGRGHGVISYPSKFAKGRLAGALIRRQAAHGRVADVEDVAAAWLDCGGARAEIIDANRIEVYTA